MNGLFNIKKWYSLEAAASRLSQTFGQQVSLMDVAQFVADDQLIPFWRLENEDLLPSRAVRFPKNEAGEWGFDWDRQDLKRLQTGIYEVLFAHGEYSTLKINLRRFLKGEGPQDISTAATFVRDSDGEVYYIMRRFDDAREFLWLPKVDSGDPPQGDTVLVNADGKPFKRYEYPIVDHGYGLTFSSMVPDVSEIVFTKQEMERFEKAALGGGQSTADWAHAIRSEATRWYIEQIETRRTRPTKMAISKEMAVWCRNNEVATDTGEYPKAEYIRRHVLNSWKQP